MTNSITTCYNDLRSLIQNAAPRLISDGDELTDAIEASGVVVSPAPRRLELGAAQLLHTLLGHIPANPSKSMNTRLLAESYVYAASSPRSDQGNEVINRSKESTTAFIERLIRAAQDQRQRVLASSVDGESDDALLSLAVASFPSEKFFVVRGSRGVGKTYYLNHIVSSYRQRLDDEKVVWVRLNLPVSRNFDDKIEHWVDSQIVKILLRYYDPESKYFDKTKTLKMPVYQSFIDSINNLADTEPKSDLLEQLSYIRSIFMERGEEEDISPTLVSLRICALCHNFCHDNRLGIIVVFDGFDRLDYDIHSSRRFSIIRDQLQKYSTSGANTGRIYVVVTRTYTFEK